ncbi:MAG: hypothetical protein HZC14_02035 [Candidatus Niyogibacteria bacterium]|nr:hypothetical protein [Candidatus Niyogibacteria bacterium]
MRDKPSINKRQKKIWFLLSVLAFLTLTPLILLYTGGYRFSDNWSLAKTGGIYIYSPISGSEIFLNNVFQKQTNILQSGVFIQNLKPKTYSTLVAKEGYWPWQKQLTVEQQLVTEARAFLIPQSPRGKTLLRGPLISIYAPANDLLIFEEIKNRTKKIVFYLPNSGEFLTNFSPDTTQILSSAPQINSVYSADNIIYVKRGQKTIKAEIDLSANTVKASYGAIPDNLTTDEKTLNTPAQFIKYDPRNDLRIWKTDANEIWAEWINKNSPLPYYMRNEKEVILQTKNKIKNLDFFPYRRDVIIFAAGNEISAMEIDGRGGRNIQPIYKGKNPNFAVFPSQKIIYILDDGALSQIEL